ncbi:MAG: TIR domain-containing protein [Pseudonocardiaceae bacterium]
MARVFVSCAREDLALAREVHRWLVEAGHEVFLDRDPRDGVAIGEQWRQRLHERLQWADAVVCMVTSRAVASSWCIAEIATAQSRGSRLLPLLAEPHLTHPLLTEVQHTDITQNPAAARAELVEALRRIDAAGGSGWPDDRCPFPGLRPFDTDRHRVFFGRAEEVKQLAELVRCAGEGAALLVVGPSGCGKSSLVRAGLLPVLADELGWRVLPPIQLGVDPVGALARELAAAARRIGLDWTMEHVRHRLGEDGVADLADELLLADPDGPQRRLLVVVDQFEELLTHTAPDERARFAELLCPGPARVVGTLRPEFLDQLLADPGLATLPACTYLLRPLHREALRLVIEGPAQLAGIDVEDHLVARLIDDTDTGDALPLLAFTLAQLAEGVGRGGQLSAARYDQLGGVQGALTRQADAALAAGGRKPEEVIAGLLRLVTVDEQGRPTRWRVRRDELPAPVVADLDAFVAARLLTTDTDNGAVVIGVAHEAFLSAWPPLAKAITANVTALRARRAVEHAATEWDGHGRPASRLWGGDQLAAAVADTGARIRSGGTPSSRQGPSRWLPRRHQVLVTDRVDLTVKARGFLHVSIRRDRSRRRRVISVLSVLLIFALAAAGFAVFQQRIAEQGQRTATARQLVLKAEAARRTDMRAALLRGLAADRIHSDGETQSSLLNTLTAGPYAGTLTGHKGAVNSVAFAPDGRTLATGSEDKTVILWDLADRTQPRQLGSPLIGHTGPVNSVVWTPDGRTLVTGSSDHTVILWDLTDRAQPHQLGSPLDGNTGSVVSMALAPDGHTLATGSSDGITAILWDLTDRSHSRRLGLPLHSDDSSINVVAFTPHGHVLATSDIYGNTALWDVTNRSQPYQLEPALTGPAGQVNVVAFAPDGRTLVTGDADGTAILWDLTAGPVQPQRLGPPLAGHSKVVWSVAFAPDGHTLATGSWDKTVILWDLIDPVQPQRLGQPLIDHSGEVLSVAFAPDGRTLTTGSTDRTAILWDLADRAHPRRLGQPLTGRTVFSVAFSPDGHTLATGGPDKTVVLWDLADRTKPRQLGPPLTGHTAQVWSVAFAPDGHTLATGSDDGTVILWNLIDRAHPRQLGQPLTGHTGSVKSVAFSPDGHILATGSDDDTTILWKLTDLAQPHSLGPPLTGMTNGSLRSIRVGVKAVAFSPDGHTLAAGSIDGTVTRWDLTGLNRVRDHVVERACSATHGGLDRAEWARYIPDLPYQETCPA